MSSLPELKRRVRTSSDRSWRIAAKLNRHDHLRREILNELKRTRKAVGRVDDRSSAAVRSVLRRAEALEGKLLTEAEAANVDLSDSGESRAPECSASATSEELTRSGEEATPGIDTRNTSVGFGGKLAHLDTPLAEEHLEEVARRYRFVSMVAEGRRSVKEALAILGIDKTPRWGRKMRKRFEEEGVLGLVDKRWLRKTSRTAMGRRQQILTLGFWHTYPAAPDTLVHRLMAEAAETEGIRVPSYRSVKNFLDNLSPAEKETRGGRMETWDKQGRPVVRAERARGGNDRFQLDHTELSIWIRRLNSKEEWVPSRVYLTVALDAFSRSVAGLVLSAKYPDSWSIALMLRHAIQAKDDHPDWHNKGLPRVVQIDHGRDFMSGSIAATLAHQHVEVDPGPPYYPNDKGKVERWFLTLDAGLLRALPGHKENIGRSEGAARKNVRKLLTRKQLRDLIVEWIVETYHQTVHSETDRKPAELWEETVVLRLPDEESAFFASLLQLGGSRVVQRTGVRFQHRRYWSPDLVEHWKETLEVRHNPEDRRSILLYCDHSNHVGPHEAWDLTRPDSRYGLEDVKTARKQYRKGLKARYEEYVSEVVEHDRRRLKQDGWAEAREAAAEAEAAAPTESKHDPAPDPVEDLLDRFDQLDRAKG